MANPNNPNQTPQDPHKKPGDMGNKPIDQQGQKAQPKTGHEDMDDDKKPSTFDKNKKPNQQH